MKRATLTFAAVFGLALFPLESTAQSRGFAYNFDGPVSTKSAVLICARDCGRGEATISISTDNLDMLERLWPGLRPALEWTAIPTSRTFRPPSARASCSSLRADFHDVNRVLSIAERTVERMLATGYYYAVDSRTTRNRVSRRDAAFGATVERWKLGHAAALDVAIQVVEAWNANGCARG